MHFWFHYTVCFDVVIHGDSRFMYCPLSRVHLYFWLMNTSLFISLRLQPLAEYDGKGLGLIDQVNGWKSSHHNVSKLQGSWVSLSEANRVPVKLCLPATVPKLKSQLRQRKDLFLFLFSASVILNEGKRKNAHQNPQGGFVRHRTKIFLLLPHTWKHCFVFARDPCLYSES